ncbi:flagellar FliJ family protein [Gammaproteobacteria bacterium]|nr:flagellar FliJ family protein [Gammaproteobacteria bacterium]MDB2443582.1 flagellar FliJ family protein [Gammaproteobacteria bacterium]
MKIWQTLSNKESALIGKLRTQQDALDMQKKKLAARIKDIDQYIFEYSTGIRDESETNFDVQKVQDKLKMISQLTNARGQLVKFDAQCDLNLTQLSSQIVNHEVERMKFEKIRLQKKENFEKIERRIDSKNLDEIALRNFLTSDNS